MTQVQNLADTRVAQKISQMTGVGLVTGVGSVHHTQCWSVHGDCARAEVIRLQNVVATLREELAATRRELLLATTEGEK